MRRVHDLHVGEFVFAFSEHLGTTVRGIIEGFSGDQSRVKIIEEKEEGPVRHIVSEVYVTKDEDSAEELMLSQDLLMRIKVGEKIAYRTGMSVHLKKVEGGFVEDREGYPLIYQIIKIHKNREVSLVNVYGEFIGRFSQSDILFCSEEPLIKPEDFHVGQRVSWVEKEAVYEGIIIDLRRSRARVSQIKRLHPIDETISIEYYKLQSEDYLPEVSHRKNITSIVGDTIDSE